MWHNFVAITGKQPAICRPKPSWESCLKRARENVKYVDVCKKLLITPTFALSVEEKKIKDEVEWGREFDELKALKEVSATPRLLDVFLYAFPISDRDAFSNVTGSEF